jgi:hypothetical protein
MQLVNYYAELELQVKNMQICFIVLLQLLLLQIPSYEKIPAAFDATATCC